MRVFNTDIHVVTFGFIVLEAIFFVYQFYYYLCWPRDKTRKYYLILLALLIVKNLAMGLFPDPRFKEIPIIWQYSFTYAAGFVMASYFPFYFYKSYNLTKLKFHAIYGVFLFLYFPFLFIFFLEYYLTGDIDQAIAHGLYVPAAYSVVLAYVMWKSIQSAFMKEIEDNNYTEIIAMYFSVIPFVAIAFFPNIAQVTEAVITNIGFTILTIFFIKRSFLQARKDRERLLELLSAGTVGGPLNVNVQENEQDENIFEINMAAYQLTRREKDVVRLVRLGKPYKEVAGDLNVSEKTVKKHIENIFEKLEVTNKVELLHKIMQDHT